MSMPSLRLTWPWSTTRSHRPGRNTSDPDVPMLRRVRWRLIAWSAGSTLVVLLVLGALLYWVVASSLADQSIARLKDRAALVQQQTVAMTTGGSIGVPAGHAIEVGVTMDPALPGVVVGGALDGTVAFVVNAAAPPGLGPGPAPAPEGRMTNVMIAAPDPATVAAAASGQTVVAEVTYQGQPARTLTSAVQRDGQTLVVQAIDFRTGELSMLRTLLTALVIGGLLVLVASVVVGYTYAGRALVPIRQSLRRQREFAADASHELRTPLAIVRGAADELRRSVGSHGAAGRSLEDIEAGTTRLSRLVDELLLLARTDAEAVELDRSPTDLAEVATDGVTALEPVATARGVGLRLDIESAPIVGDHARLVQLLGILVDNAIRHSPTGGHVTVTARAGASITVEDDGPGIAAEHLPRLFDRFWRAPGSPPDGTGLGLAIAAWIAERHGGRVNAENRSEGGARFRLSMPSA